MASYLIRRPSLTPDDALVEYADFYRTCWRVRDHVVVGLFDDVIADFGSVVRAVNERFGTSFQPYEPTAANQASGEWLLFTDADVLFKPDSLRRALAYAEAERAGHLVLFPRMIMKRVG